MTEGNKAPLKKLGTMKVIDVQTGEVIEEKQNVMTLLPAPEGTCQECAVDHPHDLPHDQRSTFYQYRFYATHGKWPTWTDAMSHCTAEVQQEWRENLVIVMERQGIKVPDDLKTAVMVKVGR